MASSPLQPPPMQKGAVGPVIGVLVVITILGAIAVMIGRLCSGRGIRGHARYDFEKWIDTKCGSCIDGSLDHRVTITSAAPEVANQTQPQPQQHE